jgi:hypothetical protein
MAMEVSRIHLNTVLAIMKLPASPADRRKAVRLFGFANCELRITNRDLRAAVKARRKNLVLSTFKRDRIEA